MLVCLKEVRFDYINIYISIVYIYFSKCLRSLHAPRNCQCAVQNCIYIVSSDEAHRSNLGFYPTLPLFTGRGEGLFNTATHRGSRRDLPPLTRRRSLPPARLGLSFFSPPLGCLDTSTYVYARERMRANNGPACI